MQRDLYAVLLPIFTVKAAHRYNNTAFFFFFKAVQLLSFDNLLLKVYHY